LIELRITRVPFPRNRRVKKKKTGKGHHYHKPKALKDKNEIPKMHMMIKRYTRKTLISD